MKYHDTARVRNSKFMQRLYELGKLHAERQYFWIVDGLENLLELGERDDKKRLRALHNGGGTVLDKIDCITRES